MKFNKTFPNTPQKLQQPLIPKPRTSGAANVGGLHLET